MQLNDVSQRIKDAVSGYVKTIELLLPNNNSYNNIPIAIIDIIILYYRLRLQFKRDICGNDLEFIGDKTLKKVNKSYWSTCLLDDEITNKVCNKFHLEFKIKTSMSTILFGFITSTVEKSIKNWNWHLGSTQESPYSVGIVIYPYRNDFQINLPQDKTVTRAKGYYKSDTKFTASDLFGLLFNFANKEVIITHNGQSADKLILHKFESITPGFTLYKAGEVIEVTKCDFL
eukprot:479531_1